MPRVSCVMAAWNSEMYLGEAIDSILRQTFRDVELVVVNDGSTDGTAEILDHLQRGDRRIRVFNEPHRGLVASLNRGITIANGEFIARMDADDVSMPDRFACQVEYLDRHRDIGICGSWIETFGNGASEVVKYPSDDGAIRCQLLFSSALAHPAVMFRRTVLLRHGLQYDERALHAEDYDLWVRAAQHTRFANLPAVLLRYRVHPQQIGRRLAEHMEASSDAVRLTQLTRLGIHPNTEESRLHHNLSLWRFESSSAFLCATREWLGKLAGANAGARVYPESAFRGVLGQKWSNVCLLATREGLRTFVAFWRAPRLALSVWSLGQHVRFALKCLFRKDPRTKFVKIRG